MLYSIWGIFEATLEQWIGPAIALVLAFLMLLGCWLEESQKIKKH